jgi:hypothetical protein
MLYVIIFNYFTLPDDGFLKTRNLLIIMYSTLIQNSSVYISPVLFLYNNGMCHVKIKIYTGLNIDKIA